MRLTILLTAALTPLAVLAAPVALGARGDKFCAKIFPAPGDAEVKNRHDKFVDAFLVKKDVALAFENIAPEYVNHNPFAQNGAAWALNFLKDIWGSQQITIRRTLYRNNTSWINYDGSWGTIIDRYRWEGGCIVEHWDSGETWPTS
ncbi:hypothetical protein B0T19DRAFT_273419 [Cercophora scortea]|uniref:SnoaL-like domain-containing protein n=1 Tax=Cercophora scortea TaxID=314031 RepID=A0AAE0I7A7_9PEZI|nr:hypothetical protein B0T19DRAFT_273419 [Cercophora scortea]